MDGDSGVRMQVLVLGAVGVRRADETVELGERLQRLLAGLAVSAGSVVSIDRLSDIVWAGEPPDGAVKTLRTYVTRLRQAIDADRDVVAFRQPGYVLDLLPGELDSDQFERELDSGLAFMRTAEPELAIPILTSAIDRWSGNAFAWFADEEWARPEAVRLEERRLEAREALVEALLAVGDTDHAVADARRLVESETLRDRPRALLMRSLYASGRQAEALRVATEYRRHLVDEAGLDPSDELIELEGRIARGGAAEGPVQVLRGYELRERVGEGAFAVVHRAVQPGLGRDVAVKIIRGVLADRPDFIRRFEFEAQTVARVEHPNVVPLYDYWREPGAAYLVMRLLRGGSVEHALRSRGPFSREQALKLLDEVGGALETAHRAGVVHRDVRPANLLLDDVGVAYLADFGIALPIATVDDLPIVSPAYAAPEVLRGEPAGAAADVLSLGVTVFELLTGRLPFADSADRAEVVRRQLDEPLPPVRATRTDLPAAVDDVLARATAKAAGDRHSTVAALVDELHAALDPSPSVAARRATARPSVPIENPYVGLHAFDEQDAERFHGREALVIELVDALEQRPFVVVVGASGSGKSSVVRAGLLPAVRRGAIPGSESWFVTTMLPGGEPVDALETALLRIAVNPPASLRTQLSEPGGLLRAIRRVLPDDRAHMLLVIDQFEELFTHVDDSDGRDRFLTELANAITVDDSPLHVVATLRADHYDAPLRHPAMADLVTDGTVTVRPMAADEIERAITRPANAVGVDVEPALLADLVAEVGARPAALPLLQFSLTELFERRVTDVMLHETHQEIGGLTGALAARADRIIDTGDDRDHTEARRIFGRLVTLGDGTEDTRRRILRRELGDDERTAWLVDAFVNARLLATDRDPTTREPTLEVAHEALLRDWPRLRAWLDEDRADLRTLRQVTTYATGWDASGREPTELARGTRLDTALDLAHRHPDWLNEVEADWVAASRTAATAEAERDRAAIERDRQQNRRLRGLLVAAAALLVIALVGAIGALILRNQAVDSEQAAETAREEALAEADRADSARDDAEGAREDALAETARADEARDDGELERIVAVSAAQVDNDPELAILLALEANRRRDDISTRTAVHRSIASEPRRIATFPARFEEPAVPAFSRDGVVGVTAAYSGAAEWFDPLTGQSDGRLDFDAPIAGGHAVSADGSIAAFALVDRTIRFIRSADLTSISTVETGAFGADHVSFDGSGQRAAFAAGGEAFVVDIAGGRIISSYQPEANAETYAFSATVSPDGEVVYVGWEDVTGDYVEQGVDAFDALTGELRQRWSAIANLNMPVATHAVSPGGAVAIGYLDGLVQLFRDDQMLELRGHGAQIVDMTFGEDLLVTAGADDRVLAWGFDGTQQWAPLTTHGEVDGVRLVGDQLFVGYFADGWQIYDVSGGLVLEEQRLVDAGFAHVYPGLPWYETPVDGETNMEIRRLDDDALVAKVVLPFDDVVGGPGYASLNGAWMMNYPGGDAGTNVLVFTEVGGTRQHVHETQDLYERLMGEPLSPEDRLDFSVRPGDDGDRFWFGVHPRAGGGVAGWMDMVTGDVISGPAELPGQGAPPKVLDDGRVAFGGATGLTILPADLDEPAIVVDDSAGHEVLDQDPVSGRLLIAGHDIGVGVLDLESSTVDLFEEITGDHIAGAFSPNGSMVAILTLSDGIQLYDVATGRRVGIALDSDSLGPNPRPAITWSEDGRSIWTNPDGGPARLQADPTEWRDTACGVVHRELTVEEWRRFVSPDSEPVASCPGR